MAFFILGIDFVHQTIHVTNANHLVFLETPNHQSLRLTPIPISSSTFPPLDPSSTYPSQRIHKLRILPVRQIQPLLVRQLRVPRPRAVGGLDLVLPPAVPPDEAEVDEAGGPADDDGDFGGDVVGGVFGAEGLWTCVGGGRCQWSGSGLR